MPYLPHVDGLRAIAVTVVILFHAGVPQLSGGFVGVDVFFVISGFLITSQIIELQKRGPWLVEFYQRRVRRIFPAMFVVISASAIMAAILLMPEGFDDFGKSAAASSLFSANLLFWWQTGYFDAPAASKPLLHLWSLSVEEQFYLLFPFAMLLLWRRAIVAAVLVASFIACVLVTIRSPSAAFYLAPMRAWEFLLGASLVLYGGAVARQSVRESLSVVGLAMIAASVALYRVGMPFPGYAALLPCLGTALIIQDSGTTALVDPAAGVRRPDLLFALPVALAGFGIRAAVQHCPTFSPADRRRRGRLGCAGGPDVVLRRAAVPKAAHARVASGPGSISRHRPARHRDFARRRLAAAVHLRYPGLCPHDEQGDVLRPL